MKRTQEFLVEVGIVVFVLIPPLGWSTLGTCLWFALGVPWWGAVPLGVLVGLVLHVAIGCDFGGHSLAEMTIGSLIGLILVGMMFPVFAQARQKARATQCREHLKKLSLGLALYRLDYDNKLPPSNNWRAVIAPYVKAPQSFSCPASRHAYRYEQGRNGILLMDDSPSHSGRGMALMTNGEVELLPSPAPSPTPTPNPAIRVATASRRGGDSR